MSDLNEFEDSLRRGMQASAAPIVARDELQQRLIAEARGGQPAGPVRTGWFHTSWALPAAAAVITALTVGGVATAVLVGRNAQTSGVVAGTGTSVPSLTSSAPPATPTGTAASAGSTRPSHRPAPTHSAARADTGATTSTARTAAGRASSSSRAKPTGHPLPAACSAPAHGTSNPTTLAEFTRRVTGTWLVCSSPSVFATDDAGLQITSDGHWAKLVRDPTGRLTKGSGLQDSGTWQVVDDSSMNGRPAFQLNLMTGDSTYVLLADFAAAVDRVRFDNNGVYVADYVPTSEPVVG